MPEIPVSAQGMSSAELQVHRLNTAVFISANPVIIELIPRTRLRSGTGTRWVDGEPRPSQVARLIDQSSASGSIPGVLTTADGVQRKHGYMLLLPWDGEVGIHDYWIGEDGIKWETVDLLPDNGYERRAEVIRYGSTGQ